MRDESVSAQAITRMINQGVTLLLRIKLHNSYLQTPAYSDIFPFK